MGSYSPVPAVDDALYERMVEEVVRPTVAELARRGIDFRGVLYAGLMLTPSGPKVLEFNCRFGDPETQALLPRLESDLLELLWAAARGEALPAAAEWRDGSRGGCGDGLAGLPGLELEGRRDHRSRDGMGRGRGGGVPRRPPRGPIAGWSPPGAGCSR